jgi:hypothetical protein
MGQQQDTRSLSLDSETTQSNVQVPDEQVQIWMASLDAFVQTVSQSSLDAAKKAEIVAHIDVIRSELQSGQWPSMSEGSDFSGIVHEAGDIEEMNQNWQMLSIRLAQWVRAVSDSLGIR